MPWWHSLFIINHMNKEFERYYKELSEAYDRGDLFFTRNSDKLHNAAIMLLMLEKGTRISMFCGSMSVFRNKFYSDITDNSAENEEIKKKVSDAFNKFLAKENSHIDIILEKEPVNLTGDLIFDKSLLGNESVEIYQIPDVIREYAGLNHYSFIDDSKITRIESDAVNHTAICKIGNSPDIETPVASFNKLRDMSKRVYIEN